MCWSPWWRVEVKVVSRFPDRLHGHPPRAHPKPGDPWKPGGEGVQGRSARVHAVELSWSLALAGAICQAAGGTQMLLVRIKEEVPA
jgi:hypothetical protein